MHSTVGQRTLHHLLTDSGACFKVGGSPRNPSLSANDTVGWITTAAWCFACAGPPSILANMITSLAIFNNKTYEPQRWHTSLIMIATMVLAFVFNLRFRNLLDAFEITGGVLHFVLFVVIIAVIAALNPRSSSDFVFKTLTSDVSGWSNPGVSWGLGLLTVTFSVSGYDSVLHMSRSNYGRFYYAYLLLVSGDEVKKVRTRVPQSIIIACTVNAIMLFVFVLVLLFYLGPLDDTVISAPLPLIYVLYGATGSKAATNTLIALISFIIFFALFNVFASVSRLVWVFAKDNGLPFSDILAYVIASDSLLRIVDADALRRSIPRSNYQLTLSSSSARSLPHYRLSTSLPPPPSTHSSRCKPSLCTSHTSSPLCSCSSGNCAARPRLTARSSSALSASHSTYLRSAIWYMWSSGCPFRRYCLLRKII